MNFDFSTVNWSDVSSATGETLQMMLFSVLFTFLVGLPLGVLLYLTGRTGSRAGKIVYSILSFIVNVLRSVPFVILMIAIIPITRIVVGTSIGVEGTIPPLVIAAAPFFARLVETSLREVDRGVIEAAQAMGASTWQIVYKVLLPEAMPGLIAGTTITAVTLVSYTAMSGLIGGGGLGDLAIRYGYHRYEIEMMIVAIVIMVILVQVLQWIGDAFVRRYTRK
ncbi:binding-protein-dependent transport systems inner membrane component [Paenibacillus alvei TS-15]|uniref:Binding-protein-dependent transport systems inner membrane component n=1 Tax=Paenibacillus alvei TS-15 TaxID=1117108 RepID=S9UCW1_PAEAL|nr:MULTISPECIES: methionine ABC transporter permease [Paenibacillus]EPY08320.1 binding-protein-dependent transport systems inner membrane component [Paenibacillus alvei TS-15]EPY14347.1 binding-protein-dependent transport systems inner membrane component [Paenibacillus alvei A6-6i-x]MCM3291934.1 ABC transporter permease [Paenibacillus sp. MER 180]OBY80819.1 metal ABC transporter permease [Paenibacillus sp. KS1]SDF97020.1 D-methionine transport system permease protein [Paenibacillus sp. cl6col]